MRATVLGLATPGCQASLGEQEPGVHEQRDDELVPTAPLPPPSALGGETTSETELDR